MSEETPNIATVNGISEFLQKNGLATMLVLAGLWFVVLHSMNATRRCWKKSANPIPA